MSEVKSEEVSNKTDNGIKLYQLIIMMLVIGISIFVLRATKNGFDNDLEQRYQSNTKHDKVIGSNNGR